jgi:hypothetical protein
MFHLGTTHLSQSLARPSAVATIPRDGLSAAWDLTALSSGVQTVGGALGTTANLQLGSNPGVDASDPSVAGGILVFNGAHRCVLNVALPASRTLILVARCDAMPVSPAVVLGSGLAPYQGFTSSPPRFFCSDAYPSQVTGSHPTLLAFGSWYMMSSVRATNRFDLYLGTSKHSVAVTGSPNAVSMTSLGSFPGSFALTGAIAYVLLYGRALADWEISAAYRALRPYMAMRGITI